LCTPTYWSVGTLIGGPLALSYLECCCCTVRLVQSSLTDGAILLDWHRASLTVGAVLLDSCTLGLTQTSLTVGRWCFSVGLAQKNLTDGSVLLDWHRTSLTVGLAQSSLTVGTLL
jgi:hypothetical protein